MMRRNRCFMDVLMNFIVKSLNCVLRTPNIPIFLINREIFSHFLIILASPINEQISFARRFMLWKQL